MWPATLSRQDIFNILVRVNFFPNLIFSSNPCLFIDYKQQLLQIGQELTSVGTSSDELNRKHNSLLSQLRSVNSGTDFSLKFRVFSNLCCYSKIKSHFNTIFGIVKLAQKLYDTKLFFYYFVILAVKKRQTTPYILVENAYLKVYVRQQTQ